MASEVISRGETISVVKSPEFQELLEAREDWRGSNRFIPAVVATGAITGITYGIGQGASILEVASISSVIALVGFGAGKVIQYLNLRSLDILISRSL